MKESQRRLEYHRTYYRRTWYEGCKYATMCSSKADCAVASKLVDENAIVTMVLTRFGCRKYISSISSYPSAEGTCKIL